MRRIPLSLIAVAGFLLAIYFVLALLGLTGYVLHNVRPNEVAIRLESQDCKELVGPGIYSSVVPFHDIVDVRTEGLPFSADDAEVLTNDQQRIGIRVTGTVHRPGLEKTLDEYCRLWSSYRTFYTNDEALVGRNDGERDVPGLMQSLSQQAMKTCAGDRTFEQVAVGEARDEFGLCIQDELAASAGGYGLAVRNVVVPNITIHPTVQEKLDEITQARFNTDLARTNAELARADADRELARRQGEIRVEQGTVQERRRQEAVTADLERQAVEAQAAVIEAQKANELTVAQLDIEIAQTQLEAAEVRAQIETANERAVATLYANNPDYVHLLEQQAWAAAIGEADKIFLPAGSDPLTILSPDGAGVTAVLPGGGE